VVLLQTDSTVLIKVDVGKLDALDIPVRGLSADETISEFNAVIIYMYPESGEEQVDSAKDEGEKNLDWCWVCTVKSPAVIVNAASRVPLAQMGADTCSR
jgi:hypothetical protein